MFGFVHTGKEDFVLAEPIIDAIDGSVEQRTLDGWIEEARCNVLGFEEAGEDDADLEWPLEGMAFPHFQEIVGHGDAVLAGGEGSCRAPGAGYAFDMN